MVGRVTQGMLNMQLMRNLNSNMRQMDNLQNQLASGRRINKPSDDPVGISFAMRYRSELSANDQYIKNVDQAISWLDYSDSMLDQATNVLQRVRELAVKGANGTNPDEAMDSINSEMKQLREQLVTIGNSQFNGKYVFNGEMTDVAPYTNDGATTETTDHGQIQFEIGLGVKLAVNITGNQVFGIDTDSDNIFRVMDEIITALESNEYEEVGNKLEVLDSRIDTILAIRSDLGAKTNRVELAQDRLKDIDINVQTLRSKVEDADVAALITNLKTMENVYQASLSVGARLIRPSLVDFLR